MHTQKVNLQESEKKIGTKIALLKFNFYSKQDWCFDSKSCMGKRWVQMCKRMGTAKTMQDMQAVILYTLTCE